MSAPVAVPVGNFLVQQQNPHSKDWKTVCTNPSIAYAEDIFAKQLQHHTTGTFRLLDPIGKVLKLQSAKMLFS